MKRKRKDIELLTKLFFKLLPLQILFVAVGAINTMVDGAVAGHFINAETMCVIGLFFPLIQVLSAVGSVLTGGTAVLCGIFMGRGELQKTKGIFSLNLTVTFLISLLITAACVFAPGLLADALGANADFRRPLMSYIVGYAIGIIPQLLAQQIAAFLQLERQNIIGYIGIGMKILTNTVLDLLFVAVFRMDIWGLVLATSLSSWVYLAVLVPYYFTKKAQLRYSVRNILWREFPQLLKIGLPGALLIACLAVRSLVINRLLLQYGGEDGLSALSAFNMVCDLLIAACMGMWSVIRMLTGVFVGEEDRDSLKNLMRIVFTKGMALAALVGITVVVLASPIARIFFPDTASNVFALTRQLLVIYGFCIPLVLTCLAASGYLQAAGHHGYVNVASLVDGFFGMVIPAMILAPKMGAMGIWLANPIGLLLTILLVPVYGVIYWKRIPCTFEEWLLLKPEFGAADKDRLELTISRLEEVTQTAVQVQAFCRDHATAEKTAFYAALCLEEMAAIIMERGFAADRRNHIINCRVVYTPDGILLRIKDDCVPFNPQELAEVVSPEDPVKNIGVRMVYRLAQNVNYQNLLGLNVFTITLAEGNERCVDDHLRT